MASWMLDTPIPTVDTRSTEQARCFVGTFRVTPDDAPGRGSRS
jgi:hypothetical protein